MSRLSDRLSKKGVRQPLAVIEEAERGEIRVATLLAMMQMETSLHRDKPVSDPNFKLDQRNIFGCDHGPGKAFCHENVTEARVKKLLDSGLANGVGWTQLTYRPFVIAANRAGGAWIPRFQMRIGARILRDNFEREGSIQQMYRAYNGTGSAAESYGKKATAIRAEWMQVTDGR